MDISTLDENKLAELRRKIGFVFQFFNLIPRLSALENIELSLAIAGVSKSERRRKAIELLKMVGLEDGMKHKPMELSGREQQRVAIARALVNNPRYLLMDEPTGNLDSKTAAEIMKLVKKLNEEDDLTVILVTHNQSVVDYAEKELYIVDGVLGERR